MRKTMKNPLGFAVLLALLIGVFAVGAGVGSVLTAHFAEKGIWVSCILLTVSFLMMFVREDVEKHN